MDPVLRSSAAHVLVASLDAPVLEPGDAHHLADVLRLRDGELVTVTDGAGRWRACRWEGGRLAVDGPVAEEPRPLPLVTIGLALVKGDRPDWAVQKLTELGVDRIVPLRTARSVVRWEGDRRVAAHARLRRVAREAAMQSRRCWLPEVSDVDVPGSFPEAAFAEPGGAALTLGTPTVLVGPEGGWSDDELASAAGTVSLGSLMLRTETTAMAAAAILTALRTERARTA